MAAGPRIDVFDEEIARRFVEQSPIVAGLPEFLGIRLVRYERGLLIGEMPVTERHRTTIGNMHGGCLSAFVDHLLGSILYPHMPAGYWAATTEFKLNLLAPVTTGVCTGTARIVAMTKRTAVVHLEVENEGRLVCMAQGTCMITAPRPTG